MNRLSTPARLRVWTAGLVSGAVVVLLVTGTVLGRLADRIDEIGGHDAPQAATASDIYFALSDLDAQAVTLIMLGDAETMSVVRLDALRTFRQRDAEVDADLRQAGRAATSATERDRVGGIVHALDIYRQWVWQALSVEDQLPPQPPGRPPAASLGYYAEAATVLRGQLLPVAAALRDADEADLDRSYRAQRTEAWWSIGAIALGGTLLVVALIVFQRRLTRRYRRVVNPPLLLATVAAVLLVAVAVGICADETSILRQAQQRDFGPYLALTRAQALSYDVAGDASRYLISSDPDLIRADMVTRSGCLSRGTACPSGVPLPAGGLAELSGGSTELLDRWTAFQADDARVVELARSGQLDAAVTALTGLSHGDAAIDVFVYERTLDTITAQHRDAYTRALARAHRELRWWPAVPGVPIVVAIGLILLGVRPRLAEYR